MQMVPPVIREICSRLQPTQPSERLLAQEDYPGRDLKSNNGNLTKEFACDEVIARSAGQPYQGIRL